MNGEEVTVSELNEEARASGYTIGSDVALRNALLDQVIARKLLSQAATKAGLDRTPDYLLASRRANELLLANQLLADSAPSPVPSNAQLRAFIAANPQAFAERAIFTVQQRSFLPSAAPAPTAALLPQDPDSSVESWDSGTLSKGWAAQLRDAGVGGKTVLLRAPDRAVLARVISVVPRPTGTEGELRLAAEMLRNSRNQELARAIADRTRSSAVIEYQQGFAPQPR